MKVEGNLTKFDYVKHSWESKEPHALIVANVEGDRDLWYCQPDDQSIKMAVGELELYYRRDYGGSRMTIHVTVYIVHCGAVFTNV